MDARLPRVGFSSAVTGLEFSARRVPALMRDIQTMNHERGLRSSSFIVFTVEILYDASDRLNAHRSVNYQPLGLS
jgi:hypothetical protein